MAMAISLSASTVRSLNSTAMDSSSSSFSSGLSSLSSLLVRFPAKIWRSRIRNYGIPSPLTSRILPLVVEAKKEGFSSFDELLTNSDKPLLVNFYTTWCGPCKLMVPILDEVSDTMKDIIEVVKIDTDKYPNICDEYKIQALPTFIIFKDGKPRDRFQGAFTAKELIHRIKRILNIDQ